MLAVGHAFLLHLVEKVLKIGSGDTNTLSSNALDFQVILPIPTSHRHLVNVKQTGNFCNRITLTNCYWLTLAHNGI